MAAGKNFRKGVGAIVLDSADRIIAFRRADFKENWQGPEGGMDEGETPIQAIRREVSEEIGLSEEDYEIAAEIKTPFEYEMPRKRDGFSGQRKYFFLLKIRGNSYNFSYGDADSAEFSEYKIVTRDELLNLTPPFKKKMYEKVLKEFDKFIRPSA
jgi:putative (di)nucleoside polyphosphate hydrolase